MNEQQIEMFLSHLGVESLGLHGDWVRASCPLAFSRHRSGRDSNPSFGISHVPNGRSGYNCFSCNARGKTLDSLVTELMYAVKQSTVSPDMDLAAALTMLEEETEAGYQPSEWTGQIFSSQYKFEEWPNWYLDSFSPVFKHPEAMEYLKLRGVPSLLWDVFSLRYDTSRGTVCFPFFTRSKKLAGLRGRFIKPQGDFRYYDYKWNKVNNTSLVWMGEHHVDYMKPVVIVEGMFDYAKVYQVYPNVMANLSTGLSEQKVKKLATAVQVVGFFDDDEAGVIASTLLENRFKGNYVKVDYGNVGVKDPGGMTLEQIVSCLHPIVPIEFDLLGQSA